MFFLNKKVGLLVSELYIYAMLFAHVFVYSAVLSKAERFGLTFLKD